MSGGHRQLHTVCERFGWKCYYCGRPIRCAQCRPGDHPVLVATRDHHMPKSLGGGGGTNIVAACRPCNHVKADAHPGTKPPKLRSLSGCQFGRSGRAARAKRPHKDFATYELAAAMAAAVAVDKDVELTPWHCPGCGHWHLNSPARVAAILASCTRRPVPAAGAADNEPRRTA